MRRRLSTAFALTLLGATSAGADIASEGVRSDREALPVQIVAPPPTERPFGVPNVSEFSPHPPADLDAVRVAPYPWPARPFGIPNASEFEPGR